MALICIKYGKAEWDWERGLDTWTGKTSDRSRRRSEPRVALRGALRFVWGLFFVFFFGGGFLVERFFIIITFKRKKKKRTEILKVAENAWQIHLALSGR